MIKKLTLLVLLLISSFFVLGSAIITLLGLQDQHHSSDVIVVLGNKVETSGQPSKRLTSRLDSAKSLYTQGIAPKIIVTGGVGREGYDESQVMLQYLIENGVSPHDIYTDPNGFNTLQSATNVSKLMTEKQFHSATLVSNYYHLPRTKMLFQKAGINETYTVHAPYFELRDLYSLPREIIAYLYYAFK